MTALPNPFDPNPEVGFPTTKSAPLSMGSLPSGESDPLVTPDTAPRFRLNVQAFVYAIDQRSVDWDPLPKFIADPSEEYLEIIQRAAE